MFSVEAGEVEERVTTGGLRPIRGAVVSAGTAVDEFQSGARL